MKQLRENLKKILLLEIVKPFSDKFKMDYDSLYLISESITSALLAAILFKGDSKEMENKYKAFGKLPVQSFLDYSEDFSLELVDDNHADNVIILLNEILYNKESQFEALISETYSMHKNQAGELILNIAYKLFTNLGCKLYKNQYSLTAFVSRLYAEKEILFGNTVPAGFLQLIGVSSYTKLGQHISSDAKVFSQVIKYTVDEEDDSSTRKEIVKSKKWFGLF